MRFRVTLEVNVDAHNIKEARAKIQKLADVLNKKDPRNKAWIPKMVVKKRGNDGNN